MADEGTRPVAVRTLRDPDAFARHLRSLGIDLPFDREVDRSGPLAQPIEVLGRVATNRFCILPMEGWDGTDDGRPTDLVRRRWRRFGASGAAVVWGEAAAVVPEGRANPRQLVVAGHTVDDLGSLRHDLVDAHRAAFGEDAPRPVIGIQLTHSGRWSRPVGDPRPRIAYRHPVLDARVDADADAVLSDGELDDLVEQYVLAAALARRAGFDFVDVKHCHGYLGHELLSGIDRAGPYGGDLVGRMRLLLHVVEGIRSTTPDLGLALRLSAFDLVPHRPGPDGVGEPDAELADGWRLAFGGDGTGLGVDLREVHLLLDRATSAGVGLISVTAGSPYTTPHIQRPALFPPSDGYLPPRDPLVEVAQLVAVAGEIAARHPAVPVVASGLSYTQQWLPAVGQALVRAHPNLIVGYGRMALSYPTLPADVLAGRTLDVRHICRTLSDCTTAPRLGLVSGCYPYDDFYKSLPERAVLVASKKPTKDPSP